MEGSEVILIIQLNISANYIKDLIQNMFKKLVIPLTDEFDINDRGVKVKALVHHLSFEGVSSIERVESVESIWSPLYPDRPPEILSNATKLQIVQPVQVYIARLDDLKKKGTEKITSFIQIMPNVKLDLTASPRPIKKGGFVLKPRKEFTGPLVCITFSDLDFGALPLEEKVKERITNSIREKAEEICIDIPVSSLIKSVGKDPALQPALKSLTELIGKNPVVVNAAASGYGKMELTTDGRMSWSSLDVQRVAFRLEFLGGDYLGIDTWKRFYSGDIVTDLDLSGSPEELTKTDWSVFIDRTTLLAVFSGIIREELKSSTEFELKSGLDSNWYDSWPEYREDGEYVLSEGRAVATIGFNGRGHFEGCAIDVDEVSFVFELLLKETNVLQVRGSFSWNLDNWDVVGCGLKKAFEFNPYTFLLGGFAGPFGMALFNPFGFAIILLGAIYIASTEKPPTAERPKCTYTEDKTSFLCEYPIPPPIDNREFGRMDTTSVRGLTRGLLLGGKITSPRDIKPSLLIVGDVWPFEWRHEDPCKKKVELMVYAEFPYFEGPYVEINEISVRNDRFEQFRPYLKTTPDGPSGYSLSSKVVVQIPRAELKPEYLAAPYPCEILIKSNAGAYWITLPPIPVLTREIEEELEKALPDLRKIGCEPQPYDDPFRRGIEITPPGPSDGPDWFGVHRDRRTSVPENYNIWRINAGKLKPGEHIEMRASNRILARGIADSRGFAEMSVFAQLESEETMFSLRALGNGEETQPMHETTTTTNVVRSVKTRTQDETIKETHALTIMRVQLLQQSRLEINDSCIDLDAGFFESYPALFVLTPYSLSVYDVSIPGYPRRSYQLPAAGLHSVVMWKGMLITADSQGLALPLDRQRSGTRIFEDSGIRALKAGQEYLYVLKDNDIIDVLSRNFERIHSFQMESGLPILDIAATSHLLAVSRSDRIDVYNMENPNQTTPATTYAISGAMKISRAKLAISNNSFYLHNPNGGGRIVDFSEGNGIVTADYYYEDPWFVRSVRVGNVFARLGLNSTQLELYSIAGAKIR